MEKSYLFSSNPLTLRQLTSFNLISTQTFGKLNLKYLIPLDVGYRHPIISKLLCTPPSIPYYHMREALYNIQNPIVIPHLRADQCGRSPHRCTLQSFTRPIFWSAPSLVVLFESTKTIYLIIPDDRNSIKLLRNMVFTDYTNYYKPWTWIFERPRLSSILILPIT